MKGYRRAERAYPGGRNRRSGGIPCGGRRRWGRTSGVPAADVRGNITSHRARSTIALQLYNAKEPMTLFELQAWLGHRSPEATQHSAIISSNKLVKGYSDAGYFERNVRAIEVLIDRDAVAPAAVASEEPWQYYDLGHG
jgi:integrase